MANRTRSRTCAEAPARVTYAEAILESPALQNQRARLALAQIAHLLATVTRARRSPRANASMIEALAEAIAVHSEAVEVMEEFAPRTFVEIHHGG